MIKNSRIKNKRGMTLIELIIVTMIMFLLSGSLFWMIIAGKSIWQSSVTRSSDRQELHTTVERITKELRDSDSTLITVSSTPSAICFLSAFNNQGRFITADTGAPVWQKYVIYYIPTSTTKLLRKEVYGSYTTPISLQNLITYCSGDGNLVASTITSFSLTPNITDNSALLSITLQKTNQQGKTDQQSLDMNIFLKN